jgi:hypothetical protein
MTVANAAPSHAGITAFPARLEVTWTASARSLGDPVGYASAALLLELRWDPARRDGMAELVATVNRAGRVAAVRVPRDVEVRVERGRRWTHLGVHGLDGTPLLAASFDGGRLTYCTSAIPAIAGLRGGTYDAPTGILELYGEA